MAEDEKLYPQGFATLYEKLDHMTAEWHERAVNLGCDGVRDLMDKYEALTKRPSLVTNTNN